MVIGVLLVVVLIAVLLFLFRSVATKPVKLADNEPVVDMVLIGGGIMSATLGTYLSELEPDWKIQMYERLDKVAQESSYGLHNAGTGHSGFMEMNYTAETKTAVSLLSVPKKSPCNLKFPSSFGHTKSKTVRWASLRALSILCHTLPLCGAIMWTF